MISERNQTGIGIIMGLLILWVVSVTVNGQDIENLGMVTHRRGIILERQNTNRTDFAHFVVELPHSSNTNIVTTLIRTNDFLNLDDFGTISDGPIVLIVKEAYSDGDESPVALFRVEIRRTRLTKPRARGITIAGLRTNYANIHEILQERKASMTNSVGAPMPSFDSGSGKSTYTPGTIPFVNNFLAIPLTQQDLPVYPNVGNPMRGGTNKTYSEHMAEYFNRSTRK